MIKQRRYCYVTIARSTDASRGFPFPLCRFQLDGSVPTIHLSTVHKRASCEGYHVEWKIKESDLVHLR